MINTDTIEQEMEKEEQLSKIDDTSGKTNLYRELIINNAEKVEPLMTQMEQWPILSNVLIYVQHGKFHSIRHKLDIKAVNKYKHKLNTEADREFKELEFVTLPLKLHEEYMYMYEGIQSEIVSATRFDEKSNLSTTYLGRINKREQKQIQNRRLISNLRTWVYFRYTVGWHRMSNVIGHRCKQCQSHTTCIASHSIHCQNLPQRPKEYK